MEQFLTLMVNWNKFVLDNISHCADRGSPEWPAQTITFPLVSRISSATISVYLFASLLTTITRVSLCIDVQAPAELKIKASDTAP
jgi:hypothetical protein